MGGFKDNGEAAPPVAAGRKRKASCGSESVQRRRFAESTSAEKAASSNSEEPKAAASCNSSKGSDGVSKTVDLEVKVETSELAACGERTETTPFDEASVELTETPAPPPKATPPSTRENSCRGLNVADTAGKTPTNAELEQFFAQAEARIQQDFTRKYNFDFLNEKPLEGRFEWVRVEP